MKKLMLLLLAMMMATSVSAQVYVGGGLSAQLGLAERVYGSRIIKTTKQVHMMPEVGYQFNDWLSGGVVFGYSWKEPLSKEQGIRSTKQITVSPYLRALLPLSQYVGLFADALYTNEYFVDSYAFNTWRIGISPGIRISITPRFGLTSRFAFIGYNRVVIAGEGYMDVKLSFLNASPAVGVYYSL